MNTLNTFITKEFFLKNRTKNGGFTKAQLECFGVNWPPAKGWQKAFIGNWWPTEECQRFKALSKNN